MRINITRVIVIVIIEVTAYGEAYAHLSLSVLSPKLSLWKSVPHLKLRIQLLKKVCTFYGTQDVTTIFRRAHH